MSRLEQQGLLVRVDEPINKDTQLHPLVRWQFIGGIPESERRAFLFTNVTDSTGTRYEMPVAVGVLAASPKVYAAGLGSPIDEIGAAWIAAIAHPIPPVRVESASCQEIVLTGDDLRRAGGLGILPVPISTPGFDAAPTLTATLCITRDPDSGIQNMGTYRAALKAEDRLAVRMVSRAGGAGGYLHWLKYRDCGKPMPIAIVIGAAPAVMFGGPQKLAIDQDEIAVAGALCGQPVSIARCVTIDIDVPADAEIVIEGIIDPDLLEPEGPFGESHGHVALESYNMPVRVTAITRRRGAVFTSILSQVTPSESSVIKKVAYEPLFLAHLRDQLAIKGVLEVALHEPLTNLRPVMFIRLAAKTAQSEVWRALQGAAALQPMIGKIVIAVSEDIDARNSDAVFWSLAYRCNPIEDVHIAPYRMAGRVEKSRGESTMLIDATLKRPLAPLALPAREYMEDARSIWERLGLPTLSVKAPWHGYTLGEWNGAWEEFASRAVAGGWRENGARTLAEQRGGMTPETLVTRPSGAAIPGKGSAD